MAGAEAWAVGQRVYCFSFSLAPRGAAVTEHAVCRVAPGVLWVERGGGEVPVLVEEAHTTAGAAWRAGLAQVHRLAGLCTVLAAWMRDELRAGRLAAPHVLDLQEY